MRENVPDWDNYFLDIAEVVATRSKDPSTQVGAVVVNQEKIIIGTGYNGFPPELEDEPYLWRKDVKHEYVIHAEMNAILNSSQSVRGAMMYITIPPCKDCVKLLAASGIDTVFYRKYRNFESFDLAEEVGLNLVKVDPNY